MSDHLSPDERVSILDGIYREVAKQAAELADLAKDSAPDDDLAGAIKLLGNAMERIAMARCMAQCDAQDLAAEAGIEAAESASGIAPNRTPSRLVPGERRLDPYTFKDIPDAAGKAVER